MIGLGRMGGNMVRRLMERGHEAVVYALSSSEIDRFVAKGAIGSYSLKELVGKLSPPRIVWMMVPAGSPVDQTIDGILPFLAKNDILVDGGNSNWKDSKARADKVGEKDVHYLDAGVSGGIWGLAEGYCIMVGGNHDAYLGIEPILKTLAPEKGYAYIGPSGAGHFVKMIHNGIEYGMLQALGEGFEALKSSEYDLNLHQISELWRHSSVVRSWLLDLLTSALEKNKSLDDIRGYVEDSGEGRWTVLYAVENGVPMPIITYSLFARFLSRQDDSFSARVIAALREEFGGHKVRSVDS
jgi:6-phosphogluconate dehydrogenase